MDLDSKVYSQLLEPGYDYSKFKDDDFVQIVGDLMEKRELYQRVLGKASLEVTKRGITLDKFINDLEGYTGQKVSKKSLKVYRWVEKQLDDLNIPLDLNYYALKTLAGTDNPKKWLKELVDNGWSGAELSRMVHKDKPKKPKICKHCGTEVSQYCPTCNNPL